MSSKHRRTLEALFANPVRTNILWDDIEAMLRYYGAIIVERSGSRVGIGLHGRTMVCHRPHPQKEADRLTVRFLRGFLIEAGLTP